MHVHVQSHTHVLPHLLPKAQGSGDWGSDSHSIMEGHCAIPRSLPPSGVGRTPDLGEGEQSCSSGRRAMAGTEGTEPAKVA